MCTMPWFARWEMVLAAASVPLRGPAGGLVDQAHPARRHDLHSGLRVPVRPHHGHMERAGADGAGRQTPAPLCCGTGTPVGPRAAIVRRGGVALAMVALLGAVVAASVPAPGELLAVERRSASRRRRRSMPCRPVPRRSRHRSSRSRAPRGGWLEVTAGGVVGRVAARTTSGPSASAERTADRRVEHRAGPADPRRLRVLAGGERRVGLLLWRRAVFRLTSRAGPPRERCRRPDPVLVRTGYELVSAVEQTWKFGHGKP